MKTSHALATLQLLLAAGSFSSCASMDSLPAAKNAGAGTVRVYAVSQDQAWAISWAVFRWEGADAIIGHRDQGYMLTSSGPGPSVSPGAVMGAWLEAAGEGQTKVTVITKRLMPLEPTITLTESTYHQRFALAVDILKAGKTLPLAPPY